MYIAIKCIADEEFIQEDKKFYVEYFETLLLKVMN